MAETKHDSKNKSRKSNPFISEHMWEDFAMGPWSDRLRAMGEAQTRSLRHVSEQYLSYGRQLNEQLSAQLQVSAKLAKDGVDYGVNLLDAWNKIVVEATETALDSMSPRA